MCQTLKPDRADQITFFPLFPSGCRAEGGGSRSRNETRRKDRKRCQVPTAAHTAGLGTASQGPLPIQGFCTPARLPYSIFKFERSACHISAVVWKISTLMPDSPMLLGTCTTAPIPMCVNIAIDLRYRTAQRTRLRKNPFPLARLHH